MDEGVGIRVSQLGSHTKLVRAILRREQSRDSVGTVLCVDDDGILRVGFPGASRGWKADPAEMQRVDEFKVGDWVRIRPSLTTVKHGLGSVTPGSIGIVYCIRPDASLLLELTYLPSPWHCEPEEVEPVTPFKIGDRVFVKRSVAEPRYAWGGETHHSVGKISEIESDGLLMIEIPNRPIPWQADPSDMEKLDDFKVGDWVKVKASVPSPKYGWENITRNSIGVIHRLEEDGDAGVAFCFRTKLFSCSVTDVELVTPFQVGQQICVMSSISQPCLGWSDQTPATTGKIVRIDMDGALNVRVRGRSTVWRVSPGDAEGVSGLEVGDWVRWKSSSRGYEWTGGGKEGVWVVRSIQEKGCIEVASCGRGRWTTHFSELEKVERLKAGDRVGFRGGMVEPRWGWRGAVAESRGIVVGAHADGEVVVAFVGAETLWRGDPSDLQKEEGFEVGEWVRVGGDRVGVVQGWAHHGEREETTVVAFCGEERWEGGRGELERVESRVGVGDMVRVKEGVGQPRFGWRGTGGVGSVSGVDGDGRIRMATDRGAGGGGGTGSKAGWSADPGEVEVVGEERIGVGDWVRVRGSVGTPVHEWGEVGRESVGVVHRLGERSGQLWLAFCFMEERLWECEEWEVERVRRFGVGDRVGVREGVVTPRMGWGMETHSSRGVVVSVDANALLRIRFPFRDSSPWLADPADIHLLHP